MPPPPLPAPPPTFLSRSPEQTSPSQFTFLTKKELTIGRGQNCDVKLLARGDEDVNYELGISRHHATVRLTEDNVITIVDHSRNGILVNSTKILPGKPKILKEGDCVQFGLTANKFVYLVGTSSSHVWSGEAEGAAPSDCIVKSLDQQQGEEDGSGTDNDEVVVAASPPSILTSQQPQQPPQPPQETISLHPQVLVELDQLRAEVAQLRSKYSKAVVDLTVARQVSEKLCTDYEARLGESRNEIAKIQQTANQLLQFRDEVRDTMQCPICMHLTPEMEFVMLSTCRHHCCRTCWTNWRKRSNVCPSCNTIFPSNASLHAPLIFSTLVDAVTTADAFSSTNGNAGGGGGGGSSNGRTTTTTTKRPNTTTTASQSSSVVVISHDFVPLPTTTTTTSNNNPNNKRHRHINHKSFNTSDMGGVEEIVDLTGA